MQLLIDSIKFAMENGGNPLVILNDDEKVGVARALAREFKAVVMIVMDDRSAELAAYSSAVPSVILFDGDTDNKYLYDALFEIHHEARRVCFSKFAFRDDTKKIYDTVINIGLNSTSATLDS